MSFTLSTLRTSIRDYTEVDDTVLSDTILERIILNAESRIFRTVDSDDSKFYATSETTIGNRYITVPTGTRIIRYIQITNSTTSDQEFLKQVDSSFLATYAPDPDNSSDRGRPKYFAHWDNDNWVVAPTPDAAYVLTMAYIKQPTTITTSNSTSTELSTKQPDLLLYACLVETFKFLKGPDNMIQLYEASYQEAVQTFAAEQQGRRRRDEYRDGVPRLPLNSPTP
jgi:hypothetical protein|tara:strand:- start:506 stop:1180 length:675 start_codon:yes stop_codon:yes gene_type:complete